MRAPAASPFRMLHRWCGLLALIVLCGMAGLVQAQTPPVDPSASDPPDRVARLSYVAGNLGFLPSGATLWGDASINRPLTNGDKLSTGANARAELEFGDGTLRIAGNTDLGLLDINDQITQVALTQGTLNLTVRGLDQGQSYEIDTPTVALVIEQPGTFRVDIGQGGQSTRVTVFQGNAVVYGENGAQRDIESGRRYNFIDSSLAVVSVNNIDSGDTFDAWCSDRDQRYAQSISGQYVDDGVIGYQDLDDYGAWQTDDDYGAVWFPAGVGAGWAPYSDGYWGWIAPWGWTWIDALPWGFAPYHYGRWAYIHHAWGWIPGPRRTRPVYAPGLVAFTGGAHGRGSVGWFPLGPHEVYNPWYAASRRYYTSVNLSDIAAHGTDGHSALVSKIDQHYNYFRAGRTMPNASYVNRDAPHGYTAISRDSFASAGNVQRNLVQADPHQLDAAPVLARGADVAPNASGLAASRSAQAGALPIRGFQRQVMARSTLPSSVAARANAQIVTPVRASNDSPSPLGSDNRASVNQAGVNRTNLRPGELPSSRFVNHSHSDDTLHPTVSFISTAQEDSQRAVTPGTGQLPQVPHFQRVISNDPSSMPLDSRMQRFQAAQRMHDETMRSRSLEGTVPQQHFEQRQPRSYGASSSSQFQGASHEQRESAAPAHAAERSAPSPSNDRQH
ncbi:MAG: DUF6600 domain-containing protein [Rhodanobacter sp.]